MTKEFVEQACAKQSNNRASLIESTSLQLLEEPDRNTIPDELGSLVREELRRAWLGCGLQNCRSDEVESLEEEDSSEESKDLDRCLTTFR
jgi:hypothetical protein